MNKQRNEFIQFFTNPRRYFFGQCRDNPFVRMMGKQARRILIAYVNRDWEFDRNGEAWLIQRLSQQNFSASNPIIFDVGANIGEWSRLIAEKFTNSQIYSRM